jgi:hypothetical protein
LKVIVVSPKLTITRELFEKFSSAAFWVGISSPDLVLLYF